MTTPAAATAGPGADPDAVAAAIEQRVGAPVRRCETHGSIVFVAGDRAFKLRKPVAFAFADLRSASRRRELALADAAVAAPLAPGLVIGTLDVVARGGGAVELVATGTEPDPLDIVTELHRYDEARTLLHLVQEGTADDALCRAIGRRIADFHRAAHPVADAVDARVLIDRNLEEALPLLGELLPARERFAIQRFLDAFLFAWWESLQARAAAGLVLDAHGDLRAEHVLADDDGDIRIVDRLEFADLRAVDVADELAFLRMELLDLTGDDRLGDAVLEGYRDAGGTVPPHALLAFFGMHRALVRAKVALLRAAQVQGDAADDAVADAFHLVSVARRLMWRARGRPILLVTGPPASGKSTLAAALRETARLPVLSSDELRPRGEQGADYSAAAREAVYRDLAVRADAAGPCVIDATFGDEGVQRAFLAALPSDRRADLLVISCHAPLVDRIERARRRAAAGDSMSDADPEVVAQLDELSQIPVFPHAARLAVDTQVRVAAQVDLVESWMDARLAASGD